VTNDEDGEEYLNSLENSISQMEPENENIQLPPTLESTTEVQKSKIETTGTKRQKKTEAFIEILKQRSEERSRLLQELTNPEEAEDPIDVFFKSIALTVKQFSPQLKIKAKMEVLKIINELELLNLKPSNQTSSPSNYVFAENVNSRFQELHPINYSATSHSELDGNSSASNRSEHFQNL